MKRIRWKQGMGEMLGFAVIAPILLFIILYIISLFQIATTEQQLIYASYRAGRAAVISFSKEDALQAMDRTLDEIYPDDASVSYDISIDDSSWLKGNVTLITVSKELNTMLPFGSGTRTRTIGMMIEHSKWLDE